MKSERFINRELSWLEFNQRVLCLAKAPDRPLLERVKFLAITASNMDEFFMVRVGGLQMLVESGNTNRDLSGMTPAEQLAAVSKRVSRMVAEQYMVWNRQLAPALAAKGIMRISPDKLSEAQLQYVTRFFEKELLPILSPVAINYLDRTGPLANLALHLVVRLKRENERGDHFAIIPLPKPAPRFISLPTESGFCFIYLEDVLGMFVARLFVGCSFQELATFRVTRNADLAVQEDDASDLLSEMRSVLDARKRSECVRVEISAGASAKIVKFLANLVHADLDRFYRIGGPLDLSAFMALTRVGGAPELRYPPEPSQPSPNLPVGKSVFSVLTERPVLLCHPYESFDPVVRFVREAAEDPDTLAIKMILYRTSRNSPIVASLIRACQTGKAVTVLVEVKARFDEARNIEWARELEDAGAQVIYGVKGLKTHAKVCLVVRREADGIHRYAHFGTGNYNEVTALQYSDLSYMTTETDLTTDASALFNAICSYAEAAHFQKIEAAPFRLRKRLLELIAGEKKRAQEGQFSRIIIKVNSLCDQTLIQSLYEASHAGVKIDMNVRGICSLKPRVKGLSENIRVSSILGRFLEHSRIMYFHNGGDPKVFISSADWMPRNMDRRVEVLVPIEDPECRAKLIEMLELYLSDNVDAWILGPDGSYERASSGRGKTPVQSQSALYERAEYNARIAARKPPTILQPHKSPVSS